MFKRISYKKELTCLVYETRLREGDVFTGLCLSTGWGVCLSTGWGVPGARLLLGVRGLGMPGARSLPGVGYAWSQVPSGKGYVQRRAGKPEGVGMYTSKILDLRYPPPSYWNAVLYSYSNICRFLKHQ